MFFIFHHVSLLTKLRYVDPETDVCIGHDVCYSKFCHFGIHPHGLRDILDSLPGRVLSVAFRLRTDYNHPTRLETQNCAFWSSLSHYNSRETFPVVSRTFHFFSDLFEVQFSLDLHFCEGDHVLDHWEERVGGIVLDVAVHDLFKLNIYSLFKQHRSSAILWVAINFPI